MNPRCIEQHAYHEADDVGKAKMLRLLNIWRTGNRGAFLFDSFLLERIRARCDPEYDGEPADLLPQPRLIPVPTTSTTTAPPYIPLPTSQFPPMGYNNVRPLYPPVVPAAVISPLPRPVVMMTPSSVGALGGLAPSTQDLVYARASELLKNLYAQMQVPDTQQIPLGEIHRANPDLYQQIMVQAHREVVSTSPGIGSDVIMPNSSTSTGGSSKPPTPPATLLLSKLSAQNALDRENVPYFAILISGGGHARKPRRRKKSEDMSAAATEGSVSVRSWFLSEDDWRSGLSSTTEQSVKLFKEPSTQTESLLLKDEFAIQDSSVPKDDKQTRCPLCGEEFETFWNSEEQQWMYKHAIRPDPNGPIYKLHAWQASQRGGEKKAKEDMSSTTLRKRVRVE